MTGKKILLISTIAIAAFGVLALGAVLAFWPTTASFAQAPITQPTPGALAPDTSGAPPPDTRSAYQEAFLSAFATRLGVTVDQIKEAFSGAFGDALDQAVTDGQLTQAQADQEKLELTNRMDQGMLPGFFGPLGFNHGRGHGPMDGPGGFEKRGGMNLSSFASALGMTEADLMTKLQNSKTIATIATEKGVDLAQVKTSVLNNLKTNLDQAVTDGKLTQTFADEQYNQFSTNFDTLANQTWPMGKFHRMP